MATVELCHERCYNSRAMIEPSRALTPSPGVYVFRRGSTPLYIGKAENLKKRLASYFRNSSLLPAKLQHMLGEATRLETIKTASEVEALIREAELIKKYRPKYNVTMRDDKNYFYVGITDDTFPRLFVTHQPRKNQYLRYLGPFTSGKALTSTLRLLRRVFPYCTCKTLHARPCLSSQIGRCPGYCCTKSGEGSRRAYLKNIERIVSVLSGKRTKLTVALMREMRRAAAQERFEEAARLRDTLEGLRQVFSHSPLLERSETRHAWQTVRQKLKSLLGITKPLRRVEGYDISNISGREATGSLVVFTDGAPDKDQYRKFRIRTVQGSNDVAMLKEVIKRRLAHAEWPMPGLMVVDGGKPQLGAALSVLREFGMGGTVRPLVTALAKREETLYTGKGGMIHLKKGDPMLLHFFQRIRDESHRFAKRYHHKRREILYREEAA